MRTIRRNRSPLTEERANYQERRSPFQERRARRLDESRRSAIERGDEDYRYASLVSERSAYKVDVEWKKFLKAFDYGLSPGGGEYYLNKNLFEVWKADVISSFEFLQDKLPDDSFLDPEYLVATMDTLIGM